MVDVPGVHVLFFADMGVSVKREQVKNPTHKWLTVGKFYYYYTPTQDAPPGTSNSPVTVPANNIKGRWLDAAGFAIGARVRVRVCQGCLVMTVEE